MTTGQWLKKIPQLKFPQNLPKLPNKPKKSSEKHSPENSQPKNTINPQNSKPRPCFYCSPSHSTNRIKTRNSAENKKFKEADKVVRDHCHSAGMFRKVVDTCNWITRRKVLLLYQHFLTTFLDIIVIWFQKDQKTWQLKKKLNQRWKKYNKIIRDPHFGKK